MTLPVLLLSALSAAFRALLNVAAGWLVARGVWKADEATQYVTELAVVCATVSATVIWSVYNKYLSEKTLLAAIDAPPGTPPEAVRTAVSRRMSVEDSLRYPKEDPKEG
jgi:hypothetical protein